jgi:hypothetical protein
MRLKTTGWVLCLVAVLFAAVPANAQDFRGRINGTVTDNTGAVLPGVTVTVSGPALIQPHVRRRVRAHRLPVGQARRHPRGDQPDALG